MLFLLSIIAAVAGVSWGKKIAVEEKSGIEAAFIVDISRSMLAKDVEPTRMDKTVELIRGLMEKMPGARISVTVFRGNAAKIIPPTEDFTVIYSWLESVSPDALSGPGTNIEAGVMEALKGFYNGDDRQRLAFLFTDGEETEGSLKKAALKAAELGVKIYSVGVGTLKGDFILDGKGGKITVRREKPRRTHLYKKLLEDASRLSGGGYIGVDEPGILSKLSGFMKEAGSDSGVKIYSYKPVSRYRFFLFLSLLFLLMHIGIRIWKWDIF
jgi:Ca-activated chloride channel family protein